MEPTSISSPVEPPTKFFASSLLKLTFAVPSATLTDWSFACFGMMTVCPFSCVPASRDRMTAVYLSSLSVLILRETATSFVPSSFG